MGHSYGVCGDGGVHDWQACGDHYDIDGKATEVGGVTDERGLTRGERGLGLCEK